MKRDFIAISDFTSDELKAILNRAAELKKELKDSGANQPILAGKTLAMIFQKPSLRTRVSFEMGMHQLGGKAMYLSPAEIGLGKRESIADIARVISGYVEGIMARVFDHEHILGLAKWADIPVVNGLSDYNHPCQGMADVFTIMEEFGNLEGRKVTYVGDGNNVALSLMYACSKLGANFVFSGPDGYLLPAEEIKKAAAICEKTGGQVSIDQDPQHAVQKSDVIYTDTWTSMGQEEEAKHREVVFPPYQVNEALVAEASKDVIVMHCLPAHRGQEITDAVADGPHSRLFPQAHNRMHAQKGILEYIFS